MSHSGKFVYKDKHFLGVCLILCVHIKVVAKYKPQETLGKFPMRLSARSGETRVLAIVRLVKVISLVSLEIKRFV